MEYKRSELMSTKKKNLTVQGFGSSRKRYAPTGKVQPATNSAESRFRVNETANHAKDVI